VLCGSSILSYFPHNPHGHKRVLKELEEDEVEGDHLGGGGFAPSPKNPQIWSKRLSHKHLPTL